MAAAWATSDGPPALVDGPEIPHPVGSLNLAQSAVQHNNAFAGLNAGDGGGAEYARYGAFGETNTMPHLDPHNERRGGAGHTPRWVPTAIGSPGWGQSSPELSPLMVPQSPSNVWGRSQWGSGGIGSQSFSEAEPSSSHWPAQPHSAPVQTEGFSSTAWRPNSPQPPHHHPWGADTSTSSPYTTAQSSMYSPSAFPGGYTPNPNTGPTLPPPQPGREKVKRSFSLGNSKKEKDWWYPRDHEQYNEFNQAQRPRDWRQEYEVHPSLLKKIGSPKNRSDTKEVTDPTKRVAHPMLHFTPTRPPLNFDIRYNPFSNGGPGTLFPYLGRPANDIDFLQLATTPATPFMRVYHPRYPWYIDVRSQQPNGVTIGDLLSAIHQNFTKPIESRHYYCSDLNSVDRASLNDAFLKRCKGDESVKMQGVIRADFLGMDGILRLQGLVRSKSGMWEMKIAVVDL